MSSILDISIDAKVDKDYLKKNNFRKVKFGRPLGTSYKNGKPYMVYHKNQTFYEYWQDTSHYYSGIIYYFPKEFIGDNPITKNYKSIAGYACIVIDGLLAEEQKYEKVYIESAADMEMIMHMLNKELEKLNENTWAYNWTR